MAYAATKERAHELIDRMAPEQVSVAVDALEKMIDEGNPKWGQVIQLRKLR